jgi:peptide/nickel transport system substrate-binding protein
MGAIDQTEFMTAAMGTDPSLRRVPCGFFPPASPLASEAGIAALTGRRDYDKVGKDLNRNLPFGRR